MEKVILTAIMLAIIVVQAIVIRRLRRKYKKLEHEIDIERRINYSHFD